MTAPTGITETPAAPPVAGITATPVVAPPVPSGHQPYVPDQVRMPEFTLVPVILGTSLGLIFAASSSVGLSSARTAVPLASRKAAAIIESLFMQEPPFRMDDDGKANQRHALL